MRVIEIIGETPSTREYDKGVFVIANGNLDIYSDNASMGFIKRTDMNIHRLNKHIERMKKEGFTVKEYIF